MEPTTLDKLPLRGWARVEALAGPGARRLWELGFIPGAGVECLGQSPLGDPRAYRVRGAVLALRQRDARAVEIQTRPEGG